MRSMPIHLSRRWRSMNTVWALFAIELALTIPALALFAIAQPDLYRTRLWRDGFKSGFNSNPEAQIYAMTNREHYEVPLVWSQFITDFNVVISVLSMFLLLCKGVMFIMHIFWPILGFVVHGILVALWGYSVYAQTKPDNSDPRFPKLSSPWYISKGCSAVHDQSVVNYCKQAQAALGVSVVMLFLFAANTLLAILSMIPSKTERLARKTQILEGSPEQQSAMRFAPPPQSAKQKAWDAQSGRALNSPSTVGGMKTPVTPRTMAFTRLGGGGEAKSGYYGGGDLPLRR
ncbi:MAG: hypothetical protein Q9162_000073 [Coniocarpon cinnabarinum]